MANVINHSSALSDYGTAVYASAVRTATPDTQEFELPRDCAGIALTVDATVVTATGTLDVLVEGVDRVSGKTWTLIDSGSISIASHKTLRVGPSLPAAANVTANDLIPTVIRVTATHGNTVPLTYSVGLVIS